MSTIFQFKSKTYTVGKITTITTQIINQFFNLLRETFLMSLSRLKKKKHQQRKYIDREKKPTSMECQNQQFRLPPAETIATRLSIFCITFIQNVDCTNQPPSLHRLFLEQIYSVNLLHFISHFIHVICYNQNFI